jgi:hypothetical protein
MHAQDGRAPAGRRRSGRAAVAVVAALVGIGVMSAPAWATIVPEYDPDVVAGAIIDDPANLDTDTTDWAELATPVPAVTPAPGEEEPFPAAVSEAPLGGFPTSPASFGILSTGDVAIVDQPNDSEASGESLQEDPPDSDDLFNTDNGALHGDTDNDVTVLKVGVVVPEGMNCVALDYRFLSDEFPEFVGSQYNDAFVAEIDPAGGAPAWSTSGSVIAHTGDFATAPSGAPVSINGVGGVAASAAEALGTTFDGATGRVTTKNPISSGPHVIFLSIFDQGDEIYDSAVMLDRLAFINESPTTCKPPEVPVIPPPPPPPPPAPGPPPPPPPAPPVNDITVPGSSVAFYSNGSFPVSVTVPGAGLIALGQAPGSTTSRAIASAKRKPLVKRLTKAVSQAGKVKLKVKLTKKGKKVLRKKHKLKVRLAITFTPTGGTANTEFTTVKVKKKKRR